MKTAVSEYEQMFQKLASGMEKVHKQMSGRPKSRSKNVNRKSSKESTSGKTAKNLQIKKEKGSFKAKQTDTLAKSTQRTAHKLEAMKASVISKNSKNNSEN